MRAIKIKILQALKDVDKEFFFFHAETKGFEPLIEFPLYTLSRRAPSTTRTPLLKNAGGKNSGLQPYIPNIFRAFALVISPTSSGVTPFTVASAVAIYVR